MSDQKNTIIAVILSIIVLIAWQYFFLAPKQRQEQLQRQQQAQSQQMPAAPSTPGNVTAPQGEASQAASAPPAPEPSGTLTAIELKNREAVITATPRVPIESPRIKGSIALKGARIDDVSLSQYRETVDPNSPPIVLLSPSGSPFPYYAEFGWVAAGGSKAKLPGADTIWRQEGTGALAPGHPVTLTWDNGEGLVFHRTFTIDENYLFTLKDEVTNNTSTAVSLYPYGLISRHGAPKSVSFYFVHEGLIGEFGDQGEKQFSYKDIDKDVTKNSSESFTATNSWLGITDQYWAAVLIPNKDDRVTARFSGAVVGGMNTYQTDYLLDAQTIAPGATGSADARLFAGAKELHLVEDYWHKLDLNHFDLLIDWWYLYFISKPLFRLLDLIFQWTGNFGLAILIVTVLIKIAFFPLANKSYASMAKMKTVQPQMQALRERYPDDKVKQQQELMELYKREKINPVAGCLPMLIQIPVFLALYQVLVVTIEMRHAPFFGWIHDLSAPDPTNVFNLFGLIPFDPTHLPVIGAFLVIGAWPLIMGITMWFQMKLNPAPPDPAQKMMFDWMPVIFTFMLGQFASGLVIYWAWNNTLSVIQQSVIMRRHGAKIELFDNLRALLPKKKRAQG
jgi:YidC/Oxa1 family membrane protein insertase